jgi:cytochrome c oxidase subunit 1
MFGRMYSEKLARVAATLVFIGFNMTFLAQFLLGSRGMPRRYATYLPQFQPLHVVSTLGSWVLAVGLVLMLGYLAASLRGKRGAPDSPWGGTTLEWQTSSPPPTGNFEHVSL